MKKEIKLASIIIIPLVLVVLFVALSGVGRSPASVTREDDGRFSNIGLDYSITYPDPFQSGEGNDVTLYLTSEITNTFIVVPNAPEGWTIQIFTNPMELYANTTMAMRLVYVVPLAITGGTSYPLKIEIYDGRIGGGIPAATITFDITVVW